MNAAPYDYSSALAGLFRAVLQASWQGSLAIALVLLARRVLGARVPARWPHLLWLLVLMRLLVPTEMLPHSPASLENIPAVAHPFARPPSVLKHEVPAVDPGLASPVPLAVARSVVAGPVPRSVAMPLSRSREWSPWIWAARGWLGGVLLLAGWLAACVFRLRGRLRRETLPVEESVLAIWQACCQRWLRDTPPHLLAAEWVDSPALVGWWRPTLLIPRRSLDVFSAQDWEHVFAHEIAHLRWRDHWSQLLLLAAWCVHWFNPVVWLGFRRLRADRELAADEWVLRRLEDERALAYGETLFKTLANRPARLAFQPGVVGISEDGAQMKQRLRRIAAFLPHRSFYGSLAGLAVVLGLGTVVLGQGSAGPSAPPPKESTAAVQPTASHAPPDHDAKLEKPPVELGRYVSGTGTVAMADGTPLGDEKTVARVYSFKGTSVFSVSNQIVRDDSFYWSLSEHTTSATVAVSRKGCAVVFAGPFDAANMARLDKLHIELTRGYPAPVEIVDTAGRPVAGARVRPFYACPSNNEIALDDTFTNASGRAVIEHVGEAPLSLRVLADGFQAEEVAGLYLDPAKPYRWTLQPTTPLRGTVTAANTGQPISGAIIKLAGTRGPHNETHYDPTEAPVLTNTDAQGHFTLGSLRPDSRYYLFVEAPGYGGAYFRGVKLAPDEMKVALGPELRIRGKVIHAPASVIHLGKLYLQYQQTFEFGENYGGAAGSSTDLQPVNGEAEFSVGPFYKVYGENTGAKNAPPWDIQSIGIYVDTWGQAGFKVDDLPISNFVFDLARKTDDRSPPEPEAAAKPADTEGNAATEKKLSPTASPPPSPPQSNAMAPTPTPKAKSDPPPTGPMPESFTATVSTEDGAPAADDSATAYIYESSGPNAGVTVGFGINQPGLIVNHQKGRFTIRPKADSRTLACAVSMQGYAAVFAGPFAVPFTELEHIRLTLRKGYVASIETTDEAGQPIAGARLEAYYPGPPQVALGEVKTGASGTAVLEHIGEKPLDVRAYVNGFQLDEIKNIRLDPAKPYRWTLKRGLRTAGIVTDEFHRPIKGATVKLAGVRGALDITHLGPDGAPLLATADSLGGFTLTALRADCRYCFFVEAPGYSGVYVREYDPASGGLLVNLGPELMVRGKVLHIPDSAFFLNAVPLFYSQSFMYQDNGFASAQRSVSLHPKDGEADFSIGPFFMTQTGSMPGMHAPWANGQVAMRVDGFPEVKITVEDMKGFQPLLKISRFGITYDLAEKTPPVVTLAALLSQLAGKPSAAAPLPNTEAGSALAPTASPVAAIPTLPCNLTATPEITKAFPGGEGIEIQAITGTAASFQVGGTYRVIGICQQQTLGNATLYVGNTVAEPGSDPIAPFAGSSLYTPLPRGSTKFDVTFMLLRAGVLHLTVYDLDNHNKDDNAHAGISLGNVVSAEASHP